jgi:signal transduction histidine kinase
MNWHQLRRNLLPGEAEQDEGFRREIERLSHTGLLAIGAISIGAALFLAIGSWIMFRSRPSIWIRLGAELVMVLLGVALLAAARTPWGYRFSRPLGLAAALSNTTFLIGTSLYASPSEPSVVDYIPIQMALGILIPVIALPLQPVQIVLHCLLVDAAYFLVVALADATFAPGARATPDYQLFAGLLTMLATGLSMVLYAQRREAYFAYQGTLKAADELRRAQSRLARAESASSMARLAAAISHELNTPVGVLSSAVDTLLLLAARQATATAEEAPRLVKLQADLRRSIQDSSTRLRQIAARVARFTNLDQAEIQPARINDLLRDVADLVRPSLKPGSILQMDLHPLPDIVANPQQLSAVFYDLINNAAAALGDAGLIRVATRHQPGGVEILIEDNGRGIGPERIVQIFEPGFQESLGRVSTGNWSMFNARQIVRELGGEICITSELGKGTRVTTTLPTGREI